MKCFLQWIFRSRGQDLKFIHSKVFSSADFIVTQDAWNFFIVLPVCDKHIPFEIPKIKDHFWKCWIKNKFSLKLRRLTPQVHVESSAFFDGIISNIKFTLDNFENKRTYFILISVNILVSFHNPNQ